MMRVGYVHFSGLVGDLVRIDAMRRFFEAQQIDYREFALRHERLQIDIIREVLSPTGLKHLRRKFFVDRAHQLLKEINWSIEARQWDDCIDKGYRQIEKEAQDISIFHAETLTAGIVCMKLKQATGKPFVYDMHGVVAEEAKLTGSAEWVAWNQEWERRVMQAADYVLVVTHLMADYVERVYQVARERILYVPNGSYVTERQAQYSKPATVVYAGNFAAFENIMEYVRTAEIGAGEDYQFWLLGDGAMRDEVFNYINSKFVNINYWGRKPRAVALDYCARAQIGFAGQTGCLDLEKDYPRQLGCPIKLFDYASCGLPFVAPEGEWAGVLRDADCAVIVEACEAKAFLDAIHQLSDREVWERKSRNGKALIRERFTWEKVLAPLAEIYLNKR
jgi:glycosyltransferase involved in cell wall biosynthesis